MANRLGNRRIPLGVVSLLSKGSTITLEDDVKTVVIEHAIVFTEVECDSSSIKLFFPLRRRNEGLLQMVPLFLRFPKGEESVFAEDSYMCKASFRLMSRFVSPIFIS